MKYIDADKLIAEIEGRKEAILSCPENGIVTLEVKSAIQSMVKGLLSFLDFLQQDQPDNVLIPRWCLENIENTLRIQYNINNDAKDGETCQDRNIKESLNCVRKLLNGEEITGLERLEPLMKQPEDLEKFTKKMDDWKARFNHPDDISIKATMAFTARMFYMYPDIAREWYAGLPKVTQD